ncbi:MAG: hypothetical protein Q3999_02875 [Buchananella hordeovulneris]|nr:hypothetical protein [Buchananella hordeovulneris]
MEKNPAFRKRNRMLAAVLLPVALLLSACGLKMEYTITPDQKIDFVATVSMGDYLPEGTPGLVPTFCDEMATGFKESNPFPGSEVTAKNVGTDAQPICEIHATGGDAPTVGDTGFTFEGDTVTLTLADSPLSQADAEQAKLLTDVEIIYNFPGPVTESTVGKIEGNRVVVDSLDGLLGGGKIVASMKPAAPAEKADSNAAAGNEGSSAPESDSSGTSIVIWIVAGVGGLILVGLAIWLLLKRKQSSPAAAVGVPGQGAPMGQAPLQPFGGPQDGAPYGAPQQGAPYGAPYGVPPAGQPYGGPQAPAQPYGAPQAGAPYGAPAQPGQPGQPYGAPQQGTPYGPNPTQPWQGGQS